TPAENNAEVSSTITVGEPQGGTISAAIFSWTGAAVVAVLGIVAIFVTLKFRKGHEWIDEPDESVEPKKEYAEAKKVELPKRVSKTREANVDRPVIASNKRVSKPDVRPAAPPPVSLYSAYRIGQEVRKLVLGQPHRTEVLGSRANEDRRAIQTSLIKIL